METALYQMQYIIIIIIRCPCVYISYITSTRYRKIEKMNRTYDHGQFAIHLKIHSSNHKIMSNSSDYSAKSRSEKKFWVIISIFFKPF